MRSFSKLFLTAATLGFTLGFFAPLNVYFQNYTETSVFISVILRSTIIFSICLVFIFLGLPFFIGFLLSLFHQKHKIPSFIRFTAFGYCLTACLFWLQGNFLVPDLGPLNGQPIPWEKHTLLVVIGAVIWIEVILTAFRFRTKLNRFVIPISIILLAMQLINFLVQVRSLPKPYSFQTHRVDTAKIASYSSQKNLIIIVLDTFTSDLFEEIIQNETWLKSKLTGFTYYPNTLGGFPTTYLSVPLILTGKFYQNEEPVQKFVEKAYLAESLPKTLKDWGYQVYLNCNPTIYCDPRIADSFIPKKQSLLMSQTEIETLTKPILTRFLPSIMYQYYEKYRQPLNESINRDLGLPAYDREYFQSDQTLVHAIVDSPSVQLLPVFNFYHFTAPHPPFYLDAAGSYSPQPNTREGNITHARGGLNYALKIIESLKTLGIYDKSLILIMADHGYGPLGYKPSPQSAINENKMIASALPLLLIKPINTNLAYNSDDIPISYANLKDDLLNYLEQSEYKPNSPLQLTSANQRQFFYYDWDNEWDKEYFPNISEYWVNGFVRDPQAWTNPNMMYKAYGVKYP